MISRCRACPLSVKKLEEESGATVETGRLYVSPQETDWPRYDAEQSAYVLVDAAPHALSMLALGKEEAFSLAPLKLFCDYKVHRGQSGKTVVSNVKKLSVIRAEWNPITVRDALRTAQAKAAFAYLMEHNEAYASYVVEHETLVSQGFPKGRKIPTYALLMKMPGVDESAARPWLYPCTP